MTQVDKGELFAHHNIHFGTHTEDDNQSSGSEFGGMASNSLTFCKVWPVIAKFLTSQGP